MGAASINAISWHQLMPSADAADHRIFLVPFHYGLKVKGSTTRNPQSNAILERIHQGIGNMIRTYELEHTYIDKQDLWSGIIAVTCFGIRSTYHTTLRATPGQLVFGRDMIFKISSIKLIGMRSSSVNRIL